MGYKLNIDKLCKEEVQYELAIRGCNTDATLIKLKASLRKVLTQESTVTDVVRPEYPFEFAEDVLAVDKLSTEIVELVAAYIQGPTTILVAKIESKLSHVLGRLDNSRPKDADDFERKETLMCELAGLMCRYELANKRTRLSEVSLPTSEAEITPLPTVVPTTNVITSQPNATVYTTHTVNLKSTPVMKWNLTFAGEKDKSLNAFLERVQELRLARNVSRHQLFAEACDLFVGKALVWFRANKPLFNSWNDLEVALREEFLPPDYDERLLEEIKRRTQGNLESIGIYVAIMRNLFARLTGSLTEDQQLKILCRNILPFYQAQLGLTEINSVQELITYGRKIEERRCAMESYQPPSRKKSDLEPDLAYIQAELDIATVTEQQPIKSHPNERRNSYSSTAEKYIVKCWNCGTVGHRANECKERKVKKFCYRCGKPDETVMTCPKCSTKCDRPGNDQRRH
jgi:hypothetical protein